MAGITSLSKALLNQISAKTGDCVLIELDETDTPSKTNPPLRLQYFPETISDSKQTQWQSQEVPGGSLPIYQWVNSGERTISFTAVFTADVHLNNTGEGLEDQSEITTLERTRARLEQQGELGRNVDIRSAIAWLRRFMLPRYGAAGVTGSPITMPPSKIMLYIKGSGIGLAGGMDKTGSVDHVVCVMTQCDVTYEAFFPNNLPRIATVELSFSQIPQIKGMIHFPQATGLDPLAGGDTNVLDVDFDNQYPVMTYRLRPKGK